MSDAINIAALPADQPFDRVWALMEPTLRAGETIALPCDADEGAAEAYWRPPGARVYMAQREGRDVGSFYIRRAQSGPGDHVANAGFITAAEARGRGVGRAMGRRALEEARRLGFRAMQFNFVVASNTHAVRLWRSLGFIIIGVSPDAFRHPTEGLVDAYVMHRVL